MPNQLGLYLNLHTASVVFLATLAISCTIYLLIRRGKAGEWGMASAAGAGLLINSVSIFNGTRILIDSFHAMAITGTGGVGAFAGALTESRAVVLVGTLLSSIVMLIAFVSYRILRPKAEPIPTADNRHRMAAFLSTLFCILIALLLVTQDFSLPEFIMKSIAGTSGLSLSETSQWIAARFISLSAFSILMMIVATVLLLLPLVLKRSKYVSSEISLKIPSMLVCLMLLVYTGIVSRQANFYKRIAMTGTYPGMQLSTAPLSAQERLHRMKAKPGGMDFMEPIRSGDSETVLELIKRGANLNQSDVFLGETPLMYAVQEGQREIVLLLIKSGADVNASGSKGKTPLMQASLSTQIPILMILLEAGANPNLRDENGSTALMNAVSMGSLEAVQTLITHGAEPNSVDAYGISVLQVAQTSGRQDIVDALIQGGAKP